MKNTLVFLITEGIGLNKKWKGNYLKLANKPNINYLISGIYPWAILANDRKRDKNILKKSHISIKKDVDSNYYEMLYGATDIKTYLELLTEQINSKSLQNLEVFNKLVNHANQTGSKIVHLFAMLSLNLNKFNFKNLFFIVNVLIKKGLKPVLHLIGDGQDERPYNFNKTLIDFSKFLTKRSTPIVTIAGRNHVFGKKGHSYLDNAHIMNYFETICGLGEISFTDAFEYANENLANQTMDADILPAYNSLIDEYFLSKNDSTLFLNCDSDDFAPIAKMIKTEPKLKGIFMASLAPIYGTTVDALFFDNPVDNKEQDLLTNLVAKNGNKVLVLGLNHKKGFIEKFFGKDHNNPNIERKVLSTPYCETDKDYFFLAPKILMDKTIDAIGKYDVIFVMAPMIAEAARLSNLKQLLFAIENFDTHLGRLINFCKCTGNIIAFTSAYGTAEKMLDKHLNIIPYNKNSLVPFVFTNGDLSAKRIKSNFLGVYSSILSTLESLDPDHKLFYTSLINPNFTKHKIEEFLNDTFKIWKETIADDLINNFENNRLNFYSEFSKDEQFLIEKQKYVVLKEIVDLHSKILLTPESRKQLYEVLTNYVEYNKIDFVGLDINYKKTFQTLFEKEIKMQKLSKLSNKYFDRKIWNTNFEKNDKWINSVKFNLLENVKRSFNLSKYEHQLERVYSEYFPFLFFEKTKQAELEILKTNDALLITQFYELIKDEVAEVYNQHVGDKINLNDDESDEDEFEEKDPKDLENEKILYPIAIYYDYFQDILDIVNENKANIDFYNKKYQENITYLKEKNKDLDSSDIFNVAPIALNILTAKIVAIYKIYYNELQNHHKSLEVENKKIIYKFDTNYSSKLKLAKEAVFYDAEFNEDVNQAKQNEYVGQFTKHANLYKEFDNVLIEWKTAEEEVDEAEGDLDQELDENGNPIAIDDINVKIKTRPEYDLTKTWTEKRLDEYRSRDTFKENVGVDAQNKVREKQKFKDSKEKVKNYNRLSETWKKSNQVELGEEY